MNDLMKNRQSLNLLRRLRIIVFVFVAGTVPVFARSDDTLDSLRETIATYYRALSGLSIGIGMLCALIALVIWMAYPSDRGAQTGKSWFIRILVIIAVICALGSIFTLVTGLSQSGQNLQQEILTVK